MGYLRARLMEAPGTARCARHGQFRTTWTLQPIPCVGRCYV